MICTLHKTLPLQYFCETCLDPICSQCITTNPHSNEFHRILPIPQAVNNRQQTFLHLVTTSINPLRQRIKQKLQQIKSLQTRQIQKRSVILKDVMLEFQAIGHRAKDKCEKVVLERQTEIKHYEGYLNCLDDLAYTFDKTSNDPYNFLILYQDFDTQLKSLELKEIIEKIDSFQLLNQNQNNSTNLFGSLGLTQTNQNLSKQQNHYQNSISHLQHHLNLPRQIKTTYQQISLLQPLQQRNEFLINIIALACQNYQKQRKSAIASSSSTYKKKLHVFNDANERIISMSKCKACVFCGVAFTLDAVNDQCGQNKSVKGIMHEKYVGVSVDVEFRGTKRHYWVDAALATRKVPDLSAHQMLRPAYKKAFMNSLKDLYIIKCCFRKYEIDHVSVDSANKTATINGFIKVFEESDKENKGTLSKITFKYILMKTFQMNELHADILTDLLSYDWQSVVKEKIVLQQQDKKEEVKPLQEKKIPEKLQPTEGVNYRLLKDFMQNPLFPHEQWQKIQQESDKSKPHAPKSQDKGLFKYGYRK